MAGRFNAAVYCEKLFEEIKEVRVSQGESVSQIDVP